MHAKIRKTHWVLALTAALLMALFAATTGFAEGEEPLPEIPQAEETAAAETVDPPTEELPMEPEIAPAAPAGDADQSEISAELPLEEAAPETPTDTETAPTPEETAVEALPAEEISPEAAPKAEALVVEPLVEIAEEAAESGVVLVDESGGELPLTETSSAELLSSGDPYYMVGLTTYSFYAAAGACGVTPNCQDGIGSGVIQYALNYMNTSGLPSNRMLYVQGGTYDGFTVNGSSDPWLTLLNGVIGEDGSQNTHINGDIFVTNNTGGFTLSGFSVDSYGSIYFGDNSGTLKLSDIVVRNSDGTYAYGVEVTNHAGAVVLDGVNVSENAKGGAFIDNSTGSFPITIKNSAFNNNGWNPSPSNQYAGLVLISKNTITIDGVSADSNNGDGMDIWDYATLSLKNSYLSWNTSTDVNWGYGLYLYTEGSGTATLENVYAYGNDYGLNIYGGSLNAKYIEASDSNEGHGLYFYSKVGSSKVEYGHFHHNYLDGLHIENKGAIYLNSIQSSDNIYGAGAYLDNYGYYGGFTGSGSVTITSPASGGWQLANGFYNNDQDGVTIFSHGSVLISNADMNDNGSIGLNVDNHYGLGSVTLNTTILNWGNGFWNNSNDGIAINSQGTVKLSNTGTEWNGGKGINVYTFGNIELLNVNSANNSNYGAILDNQDAPLPRTVILTNSSFDHNNGFGLKVLSRGSITAYGLSASGNSIRTYGMGDISNMFSFYDLLGDGWVEDTYTFNNGTSGQWVYLYLESGDFDAYLELYDPSGNLIAFNDDGWYDNHAYIGMSLTATGDYTVVVKSYENNGSGDYIFSLNDSSHSYQVASNNKGAYLDNTYGNGSVSIYKPKDLNRLWGNFFNLNTSSGLHINSNGTITLDSVAAENNFEIGVYLNNPTSRASVTVSNSRTDDFYSGFNQNSNYGLLITTRGNVTLKNIGAWGNGNTGVFVDNCLYSSGFCQGFGSVKVLALGDRTNDFGWNNGVGLDIRSKGAILLTNIYAENNVGNGAEVDNEEAGSSASVTVTTSGTNGWNQFFENSGFGLIATSNGSIILSKVDAHDNVQDGVYLDNDGSPTSAGMLITRGYFNSNDLAGLEALSKGAIVWKYGNSWDNGSAGAMLDNSSGSAGISVQGTSTERMNFGENGWSAVVGNGGLMAYSKGKITLGYASAEQNHGEGFLLYNYSSTTNQMVDVTEVEARWNTYSGLNADSKGAISIKGIRSEGNSQHGAYLFNNYPGVTGTVTVTTTTAWTENDLWSNNYSGLTIDSRGNVSLKNIAARENNWDGISIRNTDGTGTVTFITTGKQFWLRGNGSYGLFINSNGNVTLNNQYGLNAQGNHGNAGVYIWNDGTVPTSTVSLTRVFANNNNNGSGIEVEAKGNVTAVSLTAQNNGWDSGSLSLNGTKITSNVGSVTLSGSNYFTDNHGCGLSVHAEGAVTISNVRAWANYYEGIAVLFTNGNITLNSIVSAHNQGSGLYLLSNGNFYLNKVTAFMNGQADDGGLNDDGLAISASASSMLTILNSTFMNNWNGSGIEIEHPVVGFWPTLTNVSYLSNGETNLYVHIP